MTAALLLRNAAVRHGRVPVLSGLTATVGRGEAVALLGRNGAGKTSLLHAVAGIGPGLDGEVRVLGEAVADWPAHRRARLGVALVPQGRGLFPGLSVAENLRLVPPRAGGRWTRERVFERFPVLAARRDAAGAALSGGERQMLLIARALLVGPRLLLLDEPSEGLAPAAAADILLDILPELRAEGLTLVLAEQNLDLALALCPRVLVLAGGGMAFDGASSTLRADGELLSRCLGV